MHLLRHPKGLWVLGFGKMWDTFSYFGTQTILALYFIHIFHFNTSTSYLLYGAYAALAFSTPILGGVISDKYFGSKHALITGCVFNICGNLLLMSLNRYLFCLGLSIAILGSGFYKSNSTYLVGALYKDDNLIEKESGFTWFYMLINIGGTMGPLVYGLIAYSLGWNYVFLFSALGILTGTLWLLKNWDAIPFNTQKMPQTNTYQILILYCFLILVIFASSLVFYFPSAINPVIWLLFGIGILYLIKRIWQYTGTSRRHLLALFLFSFLAMFYFAAGLQTGSTITVFVQSKIQEGVVKIHLPSSTFNMLYCVFVLILTPCFTYLWAKLKQKGIILALPTKLVLGIGLASIGIFIFGLSALTNYILLGTVVGYIFLSAGELVITPTAYTALSNLSPEGIKSTMMGYWLFFIAIGGYSSSLLANGSTYIANHVASNALHYSTIFFLIGSFTLFISVVVLAFRNTLINMMK